MMRISSGVSLTVTRYHINLLARITDPLRGLLVLDRFLSLEELLNTKTTTKLIHSPQLETLPYHSGMQTIQSYFLRSYLRLKP
jgi:hypothetical protein